MHGERKYFQLQWDTIPIQVVYGIVIVHPQEISMSTSTVQDFDPRFLHIHSEVGLQLIIGTISNCV